MTNTKISALMGASVLSMLLTASAVQAQRSGNLQFLIDNGPQSVAVAEAWMAAYIETNPDVTIDIEVRPGGGEGDNIVKTRLATGPWPTFSSTIRARCSRRSTRCRTCCP